ncbi:enoyl-CoA hydratase/isomerase family protein [Roseomonas chloroacetimidivorans]|uniref:enoyl-CoA hydratase/isomerase family protein n=1 Tax=Roseomonas chloroacetimidivorans TaxID=1766656 RepID=UPI003C738A00
MTAGRIAECEANGVLRMTIERPEKVNALTAAMMDDLAARLHRTAERNDLHLAVIGGAGPKGFSAGADIREFAAGPDALRRQLDALTGLMLAMRACAVPVAVLAHGRCFGAGGMILAQADLVLAAEDLRLGFPEIAFGLYPGVVHAVLRERLPEAVAAQLCLGGRLLSAGEAQGLGLATEILPATDFGAEAECRLAYYAARSAALRTARGMRPVGGLEAGLREAGLALLANYADPHARALLHGFLLGTSRAAGPHPPARAISSSAVCN